MRRNRRRKEKKSTKNAVDARDKNEARWSFVQIPRCVIFQSGKEKAGETKHFEKGDLIATTHRRVTSREVDVCKSGGAKIRGETALPVWIMLETAKPHASSSNFGSVVTKSKTVGAVCDRPL